MKQLIVLISTIILGIILSGTVLGMGDNVDTYVEATNTKLETMLTSEGGLTLNSSH